MRPPLSTPTTAPGSCVSSQRHCPLPPDAPLDPAHLDAGDHQVHRVIQVRLSPQASGLVETGLPTKTRWPSEPREAGSERGLYPADVMVDQSLPVAADPDSAGEA